MENIETIKSALEEFSNANERTEIPEILEQFFLDIAKTGETKFCWSLLKPLVTSKIDKAMQEFQESVSMDKLTPLPNVENVKFENMRCRILDRLAEFTGAPFTMQRLAELVVDPKKHYNRTDKFLRAIEKNIMVVSTVDVHGNKIVNDSKIPNGADVNGSVLERNSSPFTTPTPMNSPMVSSTATRQTSESRDKLSTDGDDTEPFNPVTLFPESKSSDSTQESSSSSEGTTTTDSNNVSGSETKGATATETKTHTKVEEESKLAPIAEEEDIEPQGSEDPSSSQDENKSESSVLSMSSGETELTEPSNVHSEDKEQLSAPDKSEADTPSSIENKEECGGSDEAAKESSADNNEACANVETTSQMELDTPATNVEETANKREADSAEHEDTPPSKKRKNYESPQSSESPAKKLTRQTDDNEKEVPRRESSGFETSPIGEDHEAESSQEQPEQEKQRDQEDEKSADAVTSSSDTPTEAPSCEEAEKSISDTNKQSTEDADSSCGATKDENDEETSGNS